MAKPESQTSSLPDASTYDVPLGRLRAFVVFLVVVHHSVLAYYPGIPAPSTRFVGGDMLWRAFPVLDPERWDLAALIAGFDDIFFMSLMFLLSGLFVASSLERRGIGRFLRDRGLRLGIPFLVSAGFVVPLAYYTAYLQAGGTPGLAGYWGAWRAIGYWPTGPAWFVLLLLVYDALAAALFALWPDWARRVGWLAADVRERPARLFWAVVACSFVAYAPLALLYGPDDWTYLGPLQFQTSRALLYFVYFALGVGLGAAGLRDALVAAEGGLAVRWGRWVAAMVVAFMLASAVFLALLSAEGETRETLAQLRIGTFTLSCAASSFGFLALFARFGQRLRPAWRTASECSYGIYLVHYAFVTWCQLALLGTALPAAAKAALVIAAAYLASLGTTAVLRRVPLVARLL